MDIFLYFSVCLQDQSVEVCLQSEWEQQRHAPYPLQPNTDLGPSHQVNKATNLRAPPFVQLGVLSRVCMRGGASARRDTCHFMSSDVSATRQLSVSQWYSIYPSDAASRLSLACLSDHPSVSQWFPSGPQSQYVWSSKCPAQKKLQTLYKCKLYCQGTAVLQKTTVLQSLSCITAS